MFEHWSIFVQVIRRTKIYQFLGHPVVDTNTVAGKAIKSGFRPFVSPQAPKNYPLVLHRVTFSAAPCHTLSSWDLRICAPRTCNTLQPCVCDCKSLANFCT